jgi:hypothetical protein
MSSAQRQHIRFSLDIPGLRLTKSGEKLDIVLQQVSIGGCFLDWDEGFSTGEVFRLEVMLPNGNWLPLTCKVLYKFENNGIGAKFVDITRFEQQLVGKIITHALEKEGLPVQVDPFAEPPRFVDAESPRISDHQRVKDEILEQIMSGDV